MKTNKLIRQYCVLKNLPYNGAKRAYRDSTQEERRMYRKEMTVAIRMSGVNFDISE